MAGRARPRLRAGLTRDASAASGAAEPVTIARQTIVHWDPAGAPGRRAVYSQVLSDGTERLRDESNLAPPTAPVLQDPLVFDLDGRGVRTSAKKVIYGITGSRDDDRQRWLNDVDAGMGILVFDADRNGGSGKTGLELFGDQTDLNGDGAPDGYPDGFSALGGLVRAASAAGVLPAMAPSGRLDAAALKALERAYGLKMKLGGFNHAPVPLEKAGVVSIAYSDLPPEPNREFDGRGNGMSLHPHATFERGDGSRGIYANVWLIAK
ncbi:MAG: hypothetical protein M0D55_04085 [Elusimicrobiota bacterium]|nr:MAG: hypothetical protein M0D55_04085 [Elusimicrobiota bacterium]